MAAQKDYKDGEINKLRKRILKLEKENGRLKSEIGSLNKAFKTTSKYIGGKVNNVSVERLIEGKRREQNLEESIEKPKCPECESEDMYEAVLAFGVLKGCRECQYRKVVKDL